MQSEFKDGSLGEVITADTLEALIPQIKKALANPDVKCVRVFNSGSKVQVEEERKACKEQMEELLELKGETKNIKKANKYIRKATRLIPSRLRR